MMEIIGVNDFDPEEIELEEYVGRIDSVIGEDELSDTDKLYMKFGAEFEQRFVGQGRSENRSITQTMEIGWELLRILPRAELDRISTETLDQHYDEANA